MQGEILRTVKSPELNKLGLSLHYHNLRAKYIDEKIMICPCTLVVSNSPTNAHSAAFVFQWKVTYLILGRFPGSL